MATLTTDLIIEILLCLPVKSLVRFRTVSKQFLTLIDSPDFGKLYLDSSIHRKNHLHLIRGALNEKSYEGPTSIYGADLDGGRTVKLANPLLSRSSVTKIIASCNGLVLLSDQYSTEIALWNPFTRRYKRLPSCPIVIQYDLISTFFGLGYDSSVGDYKVVMIVLFAMRSFPGFILRQRARSRLRVEAWVFSLKSGSWSRIDESCIPDGGEFRVDPGCGKFANGALQWRRITRRPEYARKILAFDLAKGLFYDVTPPVEVDYSLEVLDGCLCATVWYGVLKKTELYVCKKGKNGEVAWNLLCSIPKGELGDKLDFEHLKPLTLSKEGNKVLLANDSKMVWFDVEKRKVELVDVHGFPRGYDTVVCRESLVSLGDHAEFDGGII